MNRVEVANLIAEYLYEESQAYVDQRGDSPTILHVEGRLDLTDLAVYLLDHIDGAPCDCPQEQWVGRVLAGSLTPGDRGPLRAAHTCEAHKIAMLGWAQLGTNLPAEFVPGSWMEEK